MPPPLYGRPCLQPVTRGGGGPQWGLMDADGLSEASVGSAGTGRAAAATAASGEHGLLSPVWGSLAQPAQPHLVTAKQLRETSVC